MPHDTLTQEPQSLLNGGDQEAGAMFIDLLSRVVNAAAENIRRPAEDIFDMRGFPLQRRQQIQEGTEGVSRDELAILLRNVRYYLGLTSAGEATPDAYSKLQAILRGGTVHGSTTSSAAGSESQLVWKGEKRKASLEFGDKTYRLSEKGPASIRFLLLRELERRRTGLRQSQERFVETIGISYGNYRGLLAERSSVTQERLERWSDGLGITPAELVAAAVARQAKVKPRPTRAKKKRSAPAANPPRQPEVTERAPSPAAPKDEFVPPSQRRASVPSKPPAKKIAPPRVSVPPSPKADPPGITITWQVSPDGDGETACFNGKPQAVEGLRKQVVASLAAIRTERRRMSLDDQVMLLGITTGRLANLKAGTSFINQACLHQWAGLMKVSVYGLLTGDLDHKRVP